jgi:transposase
MGGQLQAREAGSDPTFYERLEPFEDFEAVADPQHYVEVPDDWLIVVADIKNSTEAVRAGRYKDVNLIGAACITAVLNATRGVELPFMFGGDGATLLIPSAARAAAAPALIATRRLAARKFGFELRLGMVPVEEMRRRGRRLLVAKYALSPDNHLAMFAGGGLDLADRLIKDGAGFALEDDIDQICTACPVAGSHSDRSAAICWPCSFARARSTACRCNRRSSKHSGTSSRKRWKGRRRLSAPTWASCGRPRGSRWKPSSPAAAPPCGGVAPGSISNPYYNRLPSTSICESALTTPRSTAKKCCATPTTAWSRIHYALLEFDLVGKQLEPFYSEIGRPSVDPELMIRMLLIGYCYSIRSERRRCDEVRFNLAYRWFCGLGLEAAVPHPSTCSVNRPGRFRESAAFRLVFESVVATCMKVGLVGGEGFAVDASVVEADASRYQRVEGGEVDWSDEQKAQRPVREYLAALESENSPVNPGQSSSTVDR